MSDPSAREDSERLSPFARRALVGVLLCIMFLICMFGLEFTLRYSMFTAEQRSKPDWVRYAFEANQNQYLVTTVTREEACAFDDTLSVHPAFTMTFTRTPPCARQGINRFGFRSPEFPDRRDDKFFSVLVLGGSVADTAAALRGKMPSFMERSFENWRGPAGQPIRVFNAGLPGDLIPKQEHILLRYGHLFDAVVAIDGANELVALRSRDTIDAPMSFYFFRMTHQFPWPIDFVYDLRRSLIRGTTTGWLSQSVLMRGLQALLGQIVIHELDAFYKSPEYDKLYRNFFSLPESWTDEDVIESNIQRYVRYSGNLWAIAQNYNLHSLHVIQPIAAVAKPLSAQEKEFLPLPNSEFYRRLEFAVLSNKKNAPVLSLIELYRNHEETIYLDPVHPAIKDEINNGYLMMTNVIAIQAARAWGLKKK